jgi:uracil DNA glycosylase
MNFEKFKPYFHESWHDKVQPFIESAECDEIYKELKSESARGKKIAPLSGNVFRCFLETPLDSLSVIMMGMCPYHSMYEGSPIADGLLMGCSTTGKLQPSLQQFYNSVEKDVYDISLEGYKNPNVDFLSAQGVLMYNAALTTLCGAAGAHQTLWEPFTKYMFEKVFSVENVPIILLGKDAVKFKQYTIPNAHVFTLSHPASAAYNNGVWNTEGVFKKVTEIVKGLTRKEIEWLDFVPF